MKRFWKAALGIGILGVAAGIAVSSQRKTEDFVVHEWGTFLAMSGSDGISLEGMYHEEHALPDFVHARSRDQLRIASARIKGETPVIYFYTDQPRDVRVEVRFPTGLWTQWYPQAGIVGPQFSEAKPPYATKDGRIFWWGHLTPQDQVGANFSLPQTSSDSLWNHARDVDAAYVSTADWSSEQRRNEHERFLFYRGLGSAPLPLRFSADDGGSLQSLSARPIEHVFVMRVENGKGAYTYWPRLEVGARLTKMIPNLADSRPLNEFTESIASDLQRRLVNCGLLEKEARAMVNTWRDSYFGTEGVRALVVMPQPWTDQFIPIVVEPRPRELVRVMVGRLELLTPERERLAERAVRDLASDSAEVRESAFARLRDQGRYVEPILRRVEQTTKDESVRALCRQLLDADFVTELRSALRSATDKERLQDDPVAIRAQLAVLLKEVGLRDQAKAEGARVIEQLSKLPQPAISDSESRGYIRSHARAFEATGDTKAAAKAYERFVEFGSQVASRQDCRFCHHDSGPKQMSWYRDWWAGRKYAALALEAEQPDPIVRRLRSALEQRPNDVAAQMKLAYVQEFLGQPKAASERWATIEKVERGNHLAEASKR